MLDILQDNFNSSFQNCYISNASIAAVLNRKLKIYGIITEMKLKFIISANKGAK